MKILRPIRSDYITQWFGEDRACIDGAGRVHSKIGNTCPVGMKSLYKSIGMKGHNGIDFGAFHGEKLYFNVDAPCLWWVKNEIDRAGGIGINVVSDRKIKVNGKMSYVKFKFWHLQKSLLADGEFVKLGQLMAHCDNTGYSSGDHLHFGYKLCNASGRPLDRWNGYYRGSDPKPFFENVFVLDKLQVKENAITPLNKLYKMIFHMRKAGTAANKKQADIVFAITNIIRSFNKK